MESEVLFTGIGGQGVQLAAQVLARAALLEDRHVLMLGTYGGTMRGGRTDATVVVADDPIGSPPIVSRAGAAIGLHPSYWPASEAKLRPGGLALVNGSVFGEPPEGGSFRVVVLPAAELAREAGAPMAASLVLLGAYGALARVLSVDSLVAGMRDSLPAYRAQHAEGNEAALRAGFAAGEEAGA